MEQTSERAEADYSGERHTLAALIAHPRMTAPPRYMGGGGCDCCTKALEAADAVLAAGYGRTPSGGDTVERLQAEMADLRYALALRACTAPDADTDAMLDSLDARLRDCDTLVDIGGEPCR